MTQPTYDLLNYRFRDDDGDEAGATFLGTGNNTDISRGTGTANKFRLRIELQNDNGKAGVETFIWEYNYDSGGWNDIDDSASSYVRAVTSDDAGFVDNDDCTQQLTSNSTFYGTGNGGQCEDGTWISGTFPASNYCEGEVCLYLIDADVADAKTIQIRVRESSGDTITHSNTATVTVSKAAPAYEGIDPNVWRLRQVRMSQLRR